MLIANARSGTYVMSLGVIYARRVRDISLDLLHESHSSQTTTTRTTLQLFVQNRTRNLSAENVVNDSEFWESQSDCRTENSATLIG